MNRLNFKILTQNSLECLFGVNWLLILFFLIFQELQKHNVSTVVRVCEASYKRDVLENSGIEVRDLAYEDGTFPPPNIVDEWFEVLRQK